MIANLVPLEAGPTDQRREPRLRYSWDSRICLTDHRPQTVARMIDLSSGGAAMLVRHSGSLAPGERLELDLSYPRIAGDEFNIIQSHRHATVVRMEGYNDTFTRVAVRFDQNLEEDPAVGNGYVRQ